MSGAARRGKAKICIAGAGAVGGLIAARLAAAGEQVGVLARGAHLRAIRGEGLRLEEGASQTVAKVEASDDANALGKQDVLFVTFKAHSLRDSAASLAPLVGPDTLIIPAMNGVPWWFFHGFGGKLAGARLDAVDPKGEIARALPPAQVLGAVVHLSSTMPSPGVIRRGKGNLLLVGDLSGKETPRLARVLELLTHAGFDARGTREIQREVWLKLWGNMNMNPISALTGSTANVLLDDPLTVALVREMMNEAAAIGAALGIDMGMSAEQRIAVTRELGAFKTSMLQDFEAGRAPEIDAILAAPCEIGDRLGIPMPWSKTVLGLIRQRAMNSGLYPPSSGN
ncbi:MAG: 2-dehydropantoate 2-reductase [Betaproteobacteria bacterium]|nr:2-dehydropantoate 2-reductase [Betaproteobacteria bacterium]